MGRDVGGEPGPTRIAAVHHDDVAYTIQAGHGRLDITELDAVSADLYLIIAPADEEQRAIVGIAGQIAGAIEADGARPEWIGAEGGARARVVAEIATADAGARHPQLSGNADGASRAVRRADVNAEVADRAPNRDRTARWWCGHHMQCDIVGRFARTIGVDGRYGRVPRKPLCEQRRLDDLAGYEHPAQQRERHRLVLIEQHAQV